MIEHELRRVLYILSAAGTWWIYVHWLDWNPSVAAVVAAVIWARD